VTLDELPVSPEPTPSLVPPWLTNLEAFGWRLLVIGGLAVVVAWISLVLVAETASLALSAVIAAAAAPLVISLRARGWSRVRAAVAAWSLVGAIIVGALVFVAIAFVPSIGAFIDELQRGLDAIRSGSGGFTVPPEIAARIHDLATVIAAFVQGQLGEIADHVATTATIAILSTFLTFFFLLDADHGVEWALQGVPLEDRAALRDRGRDAALRVGGLVRATAAATVVRAAAMLVVMLILGTPFAGPLAAVLLVGGLIPYLGVLVSALAITLVALGGQGLGPALLVLAAAIAIEVGLTFARSRLEGAMALRVHPAIALLALPIGAVAAGIIGMIVAVPIAAFVQMMTGTALAAFQPRLPTMSSSGPVVPGWLDRLAHWSRGLLVGIAIVGGLVVLAIQLWAPVLAVVLAAVLAATLAPAAAVLRRRGAGPTAAAFGATVGLVAGISVILILTIVSLAKDMSEVVGSAGAGSSTIDTAANGSLGWLTDLVSHIAGGALDAVIAFAAIPQGLVFVTTLAAILTFFFLRDGQAAWRWATGMLGDWRRQEVDAAGNRAAGVLGGYMIATAVISAFGAATQFAVMALLGIPLALPLAVLSFFGGFIPYIGSFITTGIAFLVTVAVGTPTDIAVMAIFTIVFNIVQGNFVAPLVYGRAVSIHPAIVLLAIPAGATIAGVFGMFIVVPLIGVVVATWRTVLLVLGDGPGIAEDRSGHDDTADGSGGPGTTFDHPAGPSAATGT
jgi:predicted PurR-regulated permease PerM